jgi:hypothetical protein
LKRVGFEKFGPFQGALMPRQKLAAPLTFYADQMDFYFLYSTTQPPQQYSESKQTREFCVGAMLNRGGKFDCGGSPVRR